MAGLTFTTQDGTKMQIDSPAADVQSSKDIDEGLYSRQLLVLTTYGYDVTRSLIVYYSQLRPRS
jgi:hypothetical protein